MPAENSRAVFLSYASQDAEPAQRICDALRAAEIEVWFDRNELRGGDAWDQKIRRQIKECTLFLPVISANTNARPEGYFRLEWHLAEQRTYLMAHDQPFLVPVVVDETSDAAARVPERFRERQWTRLPGGMPPADFCERVRRLLGEDENVAGGADPGRPASSHRPASARPASTKPSAFPRLALGALVVLVIGAGLYLALRPRRSPEEIAKLIESAQAVAANATARSAPTPAVALPAPLTKAQQLVTQARALYEPWDFASADDFKLAEQLLKEAVELEPSNADAWAALAIEATGQTFFGFERTDARDGLLRTAADRAAKLAPDSDFARLALGLRYRRGPGTEDDALRVLSDLETRHGTDKFILRQFASALLAKNRDEEALAVYARAAALPGGDAIALTGQERIFEKQRRFDEAEAAVDRAIALRPDYGFAHVLKIVLLFYERGDMERVKQAMRQIPARVMTDERVASVTAYLWYFAREADSATDALRYVSHDYIESNVFTAPKGLVAGLVYRLAGRNEAAAIEWRQALRVLEQRLALNPTAAGYIGDKASLLALLGESAAAEDALRTYEQLTRTATGRAKGSTWSIYVELGRSDVVADFFTERMKAADAVPSAVLFKFQPSLDRFRDLPRYQALAAEADRILAVAAHNGVKPGAPSK